MTRQRQRVEAVQDVSTTMTAVSMFAASPERAVGDVEAEGDADAHVDGVSATRASGLSDPPDGPTFVRPGLLPAPIATARSVRHGRLSGLVRAVAREAGGLAGSCGLAAGWRLAVAVAVAVAGCLSQLRGRGRCCAALLKCRGRRRQPPPVQLQHLKSTYFLRPKARTSAPQHSPINIYVPRRSPRHPPRPG